MTEERRRKIEKRILYISFGLLALAAGFLVFCGWKSLLETPVYPVGMALILLAYWAVTDVISVLWTRGFDGKSEAQKRAYYVLAAVNGAGLAGLIWFMVDMESTTGLILYVASMMLKRKFRDQYENAETEDAAAGDETENFIDLNEDQEAEK